MTIKDYVFTSALSIGAGIITLSSFLPNKPSKTAHGRQVKLNTQVNASNCPGIVIKNNTNASTNIILPIIIFIFNNNVFKVLKRVKPSTIPVMIDIISENGSNTMEKLITATRVS